MQKYCSHKVVEAALIYSILWDEQGKASIEVHGGKRFETPIGFVRPGQSPAAGDYLVRYEPDGYLSWSPKAVFEAGYTKIDA